MGSAGTAPLKWAPFPLGLPRMGGISAWAEPGQMGFQDGAGTSWDLLLIRALGGEAHVCLQQVISPCCQMGKGRGRVQGPGRWAPRASGGLRVKRLVGWAPQVRDPWRACQQGGLPCVTPSPQGDPCAWGTCEGGGRPPGPPASAHGETWGWATAAPRVSPGPHFPSRDSGRSALSPISGKGVFWGRPPQSWPLFLAPSCAGRGSGRPRRACPPCLPPAQHVSTLQPPGCPAVRDGRPLPRCALGGGGWGPQVSGPLLGLRALPRGGEEAAALSQPPHNPSGRDTFKLTLSHGLAGAGRQWRRPEACGAGGAGCGWTCQPSSPRGGRSGWGGCSRDAQPAPAAASILPRPVPARPSRNPRLQG